MHALAQLCVRRPVFATMLILSLVVVGIFSYFSLGVDLFPKVDIPTVQVIDRRSRRIAGRDRNRNHQEGGRRGQHHQPGGRSALRFVRRPVAGDHHVRAFEERRRGRAGSAEQGQPDRQRSAADREAAGGAEVRSRRRAGPADRGLGAALAARPHDDRRQADQAEAGKRQGRRPGHASSAARGARFTCWWIPTSCAPTT